MNSTKRRILEAAEELLSSRGASETTIAEIAQKAQVADSHAYQYFNGKKGLVFSIAEERMKFTLQECKAQLKGILDPKSKLSKFIWYCLHYNDIHKDYVKNLVFDYRSNLDFYQTPAYELVREHAGICNQILKQGIEAGVFNPKLDLKLIRDIIYGTLDAEAMNCVLSKEITRSSDDWEDIISILFRILEPGTTDEDLPKRMKIINSAEKVFGELGFEKAKISMVAKEAGVAEGSIYDYFKNKEDLLFSIVQLRIRELDAFMKGSFTIRESTRKLRRVLKLHFSLFAKNRNFLKIFFLDTVLNRKFYDSPAHDIYFRYQTRLVTVLKQGIEQGDFKENLNTRVYKNMFFGTSMHMALRWIIYPDKPFDKLYEIDAVTDMFIAAALKEKSD